MTGVELKLERIRALSGALVELMEPTEQTSGRDRDLYGLAAMVYDHAIAGLDEVRAEALDQEAKAHD